MAVALAGVRVKLGEICRASRWLPARAKWPFQAAGCQIREGIPCGGAGPLRRSRFRPIPRPPACRGYATGLTGRGLCAWPGCPKVSSSAAPICAIRPSCGTIIARLAIPRSKNWVMRHAASRLFHPAHASAISLASIRSILRSCFRDFIVVREHTWHLEDPGALGYMTTRVVVSRNTTLDDRTRVLVRSDRGLRGLRGSRRGATCEEHRATDVLLK
jgi:hypothetical protein